MRNPRSFLALACLAASVLSACQKPPTQAAQDFVAAANALAQAESDYFDQLQAASNASYQLINGFYYADGKMAWKDLAPKLTQRDDFSKAKALRLAALGQLQNYAHQIAAISTASTGSSVTDSANTVVSDVAQLGQNAGILKISASQLTVVQTAITDLGQLIIANQSAHELQSLAQQASKPISGIGAMVEADKDIIESTAYAANLARDQTAAVTAILAVVYADPRTNSAERMATLAAYSTNWKPALVTKGQDIADAMKKLQDANNAMKVSQQVAADTWAQEAYQLAMQALATQPVKQ